MYKQAHPELIRRPEALRRTGLSKSTLYNRINSGLFIPPISLGSRSVAFVASEVDAVIHAMIEERSPAEIKILVSNLIQQRKKTA
ncbi:transcriptional regulator [Psychromonas sp. MB-3u-54]|uniref:helix-turn-helix transcriptional regulator n=1 Tax=Psychromonas sp. MB-3u-54 TaxID=2058319 RepID=UPI000C33A3BE|nr:AlpA family phage regulatory protein [Psychromonas sp. MB-3u-54]PKH04014.1 transcriptional regulator [Psychromonas sp. MB-3u-54]